MDRLDACRHELAHARAHRDNTIAILIRVHSFLVPPNVVLPDGRRFEFNNPAIEHEMLLALSEAIRAIPDDIAKANEAALRG